MNKIYCRPINGWQLKSLTKVYLGWDQSIFSRWSDNFINIEESMEEQRSVILLGTLKCKQSGKPTDLLEPT